MNTRTTRNSLFIKKSTYAFLSVWLFSAFLSACAGLPVPARGDDALLYIPVNVDVKQGEELSLYYRLHVKDTNRYIDIHPVIGKTYNLSTDIPAGTYEIDELHTYAVGGEYRGRQELDIPFELKPGMITIFPRELKVNVDGNQNHSFYPVSDLKTRELSELVLNINSLDNRNRWYLELDPELTARKSLSRNPGMKSTDNKNVDAWTPMLSGMSVPVCDYNVSGGIGNSECISVSFKDKAGMCGWTQVVKLEPDTYYNLSGWIKGRDIEPLIGGSFGASIGISFGEKWISSPIRNSTGSFDWRWFAFTFKTGETGGEGVIVCRLGASVGAVKGTAWFDDVVLSKNAYAPAIDGKNVNLVLEKSDLLSISVENLQQWVSHLDLAYDALLELVGISPCKGGPVRIESVRQYPGGWAVAGDPIYWYQPAVLVHLSNIEETGDWSFGIIHEISHNFDTAAGDIWAFDNELMANFKILYVLENSPAIVSLEGESLSGKGLEEHFVISDTKRKNIRDPEQGAALINLFLIRIKNQYGWEPFKAAFRELGKDSYDRNISSLAKYELFIDTVSRFAGQDARKLISENDRTEIKRYLSK